MQASETNAQKYYLSKLKSKYCSTCLSSDRKLSNLGEFSEIYQKLFRKKAQEHSTILLCFECLALLHKIKKFEEKVRTSQRILKNHIRDKKYKIKSQSSLLVTKPSVLDNIQTDKENKNDINEYELELVKHELTDDYNDFHQFDSEPFEEIKEDDDTGIFLKIFDDPNDTLVKTCKDDVGLTNIKHEVDIVDTIGNPNIGLITDIKPENNEVEAQQHKKKKCRKNLKRMFLNKDRSQLYKLTYENIHDRKVNAYKRIPILPQEVNYWMERERNSDYFKKLKYKCEKCAIRVSGNSRDRHMLLHTKKKYTCDICQQSYSQRNSLARHITNHYFVRSCNICGYKCVCKEHLYNHVKKEHARSVQCLECKDNFKSTRVFYEHFREVHFKFHSTFECDYCGKTVTMKSTLEGHIRRHHLPHECKQCHLTFPNATKQRRHLALKHHIERCEASYCVTCDRQFDNILQLKYIVVVSRHHLPHECKQCHLTFPNATKQRRHLALKHHIERCEASYCVTCDRQFDNILQLKYIVIVPRHHLPHECKQCHLTFPNATKQRRHLALKHHIERCEASYCVTCDRQFDNILQFKSHLKTAVAHAGESQFIKRKKQFPCPVCGKIFAKNINMRNHYELVHLNKPRFYCNQCNKGFITNSRLRHHYQYSKAHAGLELPKNKMCNICGRGFSNNRILTNHIRTHTGERPHACPHCDSKFAQKTAMLTHIKNIHMKKDQKFAPPTCL